MNSLKAPLGVYFHDHGHYPTTSEGLDALLYPMDDVDPSKGKWPYIDRSAVKFDPWGNPYQYKCPGQRNPTGYDLWSHGPDMKPNTADDIGNW